jgi:hypothetical protein
MGCFDIEDIRDALPGNMVDPERDFYWEAQNTWWSNMPIAGIGRREGLVFNRLTWQNLLIF